VTNCIHKLVISELGVCLSLGRYKSLICLPVLGVEMCVLFSFSACVIGLMFYVLVFFNLVIKVFWSSSEIK